MSSGDSQSIIEFQLLGEPVPWHVFTRRPSGAKDRLKTYQEMIQLTAKLAMRGREPHAGPVRLAIYFFRGFPYHAPQEPAARRRWADAAILKPADVVNLGKGAEDALNQIVFVDDAQVVSKLVEKDYAEQAHTFFRVQLL